MNNIIRKLFLIKEIISKEGELHFQRWRIFSSPLFNIYVHKILKADEDAHDHTHPWSFVSIILSGGYIESGNYKTWYNASIYKFCKRWSINYKKYNDCHRVRKLFKSPTYTLVFTGPRKPTWGYYILCEKELNYEYKFVDHETYRKLKNDGKLI